MVKFKKLILGALALTCASFVMAQTSNTNSSTAGVFGNDTDDFMDVNSWSGVAPENFFGTLGYSNGHLNLGAAKNIGGFYFGAYLDGNLGLDFNSIFGKTETSSSSSTTSTNGSSKTSTFNGRTSDFDLSALIGIGDNLGIKAGISYTGDAATTSTSTESSGTTTTGGTTTTTNTSISNDVKRQQIAPAVMVGYNLGVGNLFLKNYGVFGVGISQNSTKTYDSSANPATTETNNTTSNYIIGGGTTIVFPEKNNISQELSGSLGWTIQGRKPTDRSTSTDVNNYTNDVTKYFTTGISFIPSYKVTYDKVERLNLGVSVSCPIGAAFSSNTRNQETNNYTNANNYTNTKIVTRTYSNSLAFEPALNLGLQYQAIPEKLTINAGAGVAAPQLTARFDGSKSNTDTTTVATGNSSISSSSNSTSTTTWTATDSAGVLTLSTGFTYVLAKTVTFDCSYNILGDLLSSTLNSSWVTVSDTSVWNNVNLILFHNLTLQLSVKL